MNEGVTGIRWDAVAIVKRQSPRAVRRPDEIRRHEQVVLDVQEVESRRDWTTGAP